MAPARLQKKEEKKTFEFIPKDLLGQVVFVLVMILAMLVFLGFCFAVKGQTYGFL